MVSPFPFGLPLHWFVEFSKRKKNSRSFIVLNGGWSELSKRECVCWRIHNQMAPWLHVPHQTQLHLSR